MSPAEHSSGACFLNLFLKLIHKKSSITSATFLVVSMLSHCRPTLIYWRTRRTTGLHWYSRNFRPWAFTSPCWYITVAACYPVTHFAVHCLSSDYVFFAECPTFKTISPVFHHDGPRRVPRVVPEYPRLDLVAPFRSHLLRLWKVADSNRWLIPGSSENISLFQVAGLLHRFRLFPSLYRGNYLLG